MNLIRRTSFLLFLIGAICLSGFQQTERSFDEQEMAEYAQNPQFAKYLELNVQPPSIWDQIWWWLLSLWEEFWSDPLRADLTWFIVAIALLGIGVFYLLKLGFNKPITGSVSVESTRIHLTPDSSIDFKDEMTRALEARDFRLAIRFLYLHSLTQLSDKGLVRFQDWKTPLDYQFELSEENRKPYERLASLFEYSWYGDFEVNRADFDKGTNYAQMLEEIDA